MKTQTRSQILEYIKKNGDVRPQDIIKYFNFTPAAIHRHINTLQSQGLIQKKGTPPLVFYYFSGKAKEPTAEFSLSPEESQIFEKSYAYITPQGEILNGFEGFKTWGLNVKEKNLPAAAREYLAVRREADELFEKDVVNATDRIKKIFSEMALDKIYYLDFYSLPKFGKTKLGQLVLHGKQAQHKKTIQQIAELCRNSLEGIIKRESISAVAWAPHSLPRKIPFLKELERNLDLALPRVDVVKANKGDLPVAQKTLSKLEERITNARETLVVKPPEVIYKNILLIDDALGSGATMNEIAKKLKSKGAKKVIGFAIVGSYKGFEVIREV